MSEVMSTVSGASGHLTSSTHDMKIAGFETV